MMFMTSPGTDVLARPRVGPFCAFDTRMVLRSGMPRASSVSKREASMARAFWTRSSQYYSPYYSPRVPRGIRLQGDLVFPSLVLGSVARRFGTGDQDVGSASAQRLSNDRVLLEPHWAFSIDVFGLKVTQASPAGVGVRVCDGDAISSGRHPIRR